MILSDEQKQFVEALDHDVLVSASAGSGKTTTMIAKLIYLIVDKKVPVDRLLVVTYTEAAASEMKQKLYLKLQERISESNFNESELNYFYEQLFGVATADIGTLHSVCKRLVSKYFYEVNVEPGFSILSQEESANLFNLALDKVIQKYIEASDEQFYEVYESLNDKRNSQKLKNIITKIYYYLTEKSEPEKYIDFCINECLEPDILKNRCSTFIYQYYKKNFASLTDFIGYVKDSVNDEKFSPYLDNLYAVLKGLVDCEDILKMIVYVGSMTFPRMSKPKDPQYIQLYEQVQERIDTFKKGDLKNFKGKLTGFTEENFAQISNVFKSYYSKLFEITCRVSTTFDQLKVDAGKLDFSDLQKYTYKILDNPTIQAELKEHYQYIFVDEYQDINQIQEDILQKLCSSTNLNMIGDVKQSIYAFRQCKPDIFLNKYNGFISSNSQNLILLNKNYRCAKAIVDYVNMCFDCIITKDTIGIDYKKDAQLVCGSDNSGVVELRLINTKEKDDETNKDDTNKDNVSKDEDSDDLEKNQAEALTVLDIIKDVYGKSYYDGFSKTNKNIDYKDIAILIRDSTDYLTTLCKVLKDHKVPISTTIKKQIFNTVEVKVLYSIVKLLGNSDSDIDICNILVSPIIGLNYDDMATIRKETDCVSYYECINKYILSGKNLYIVDKLKQYNQFLKELRYQLNFKSIYQTISDVVIKYGLNDYYLSLPNGNEKVENIEQFLYLLNNDGFKYNISKCLEFLDSISDNNNFIINIESGENAVKILTMHKSKGLEYPCVILSDLGKKFNNATAREDVVLTDEFGLGIHYRDSENRTEKLSIQKMANILYKSNQEQEEQIRLLYVSLTRAKNFLYMTGCYEYDKVMTNYYKPALSSKCFLDLIFKSMPSQALNGLANKINSFDVVCDSSKLASVHISNLSEIKDDVMTKYYPIIIGGEDKKVVAELKSNFEKVTPKIKEKLATKTSVTGLMKEDDYTYGNELQLQVTFDETDNVSLRIGNAYHKIMQNLKYTESKEEIETIINQLVAVGDIENDILKYIDIEKIFKAKQNIVKLITPDTKILKEQQFLLKTNYNDIVTTSDNNQSILIQGVVDLILISGSDAILIDFKTNKTKDVAKLINAYSLQLEVYKQAVEKGYKVKVSSTKLYLFESSTFVEIV